MHESPSGVLVVDKPRDLTSHDVVGRVRRATRERRIGHTGTLDPTATGVLALVLGRATRLARFFSSSEKTYEAEVRLGFSTDTYDATGTPVTTDVDPASAAVAIGEVDQAFLDVFVGTVDQAPPPFSAKKIGGVRAYTLARRGEEVQPAPARVTLHELTLLGREGDAVRLRVRCSSGFYVRSLAHAIGQRLGTGAHLGELRRTESGGFTLADAVPLADVERDGADALARLIPMDRLLPALPSVVLTNDGAKRAGHGNPIGPKEIASWSPEAVAEAGRAVRLFTPSGRLLAIAEPAENAGFLHPAIVLI